MADPEQRLTEADDPLERMVSVLRRRRRRLRPRVGRAPQPSPPRLKRSALPKWKRT